MSRPVKPSASSSAKTPVGNNLRGRGGPTGTPASSSSSSSSSSTPSTIIRKPGSHKTPSSSPTNVPSSHSSDDNHQQLGLKLINGDQELSILDNKVTIGRRKECDICLNDPLVSGNHCEITNGFAMDMDSTNGTTLNTIPLKPLVKKMLKTGDKLQIGDRILRIESGQPIIRGSSEHQDQDLSRSKKFIGGVNGRGSKDNGSSSSANKEEEKTETTEAEQKEAEEEAKLTVEELMDKEFLQIIGHDSLKKQLRQFYKKVQLDNIRANAGKEKDKKRLYHMIFSGPPGTGKTTMANLVSKIMLKMKLVQSDKVVFINNALELLGSFVGQTPAKVDAKVMEAKGGICFIDEAYSVVKGGGDRDSNGGQFGREAIDTIMKHMDNGGNGATCVFIFAGYEKPMEDFLRMNEGLARRIPYRYTFEAYNHDQLTAIFHVMCASKGEMLEAGMDSQTEIPKLLNEIDPLMLANQNAGLIQNWLSFAQGERDDRVDIDEALANPDLASTLTKEDLVAALVRVKTMRGPEEKVQQMQLHGEPELQYAEQ